MKSDQKNKRNSNITDLTEDNRENMFRIPPHSLELEMNILGGCILDNSLIDIAIDLIKPMHFYKNANTVIYETIIDMRDKGKPIDLATILQELKDRGEVDGVGGPHYLADLSTAFTSGDAFKYCCEKIVEYWAKRNVIVTSSKLIDLAYDPMIETTELLNTSQKDILDITNYLTKKRYLSINDSMNKTMEYVEALHAKKLLISGIASGYPEIDKLTAGFQKAELIIIAGRPSHGKTALALNFAKNAVADFGHNAGIFSIEMSNRELALRMIALNNDVRIENLKTGRVTDDEFARIARNKDVFKNRHFIIDDSAPLTLLELRAKSRRLKAENDIDIIFIDYLQLMDADLRGVDRHLEVAYITRGLKQLAKELDIPVVALSQLSRKFEDRGGKDKKPQLSDLRESGAIEQDADVVIFVNRPEIYYSKDDPEISNVKGIADVIIGKQRNGPIGDARLGFKGAYGRFFNLSAEEDNSKYYSPQETLF